jgi:hypothetical protein
MPTEFAIVEVFEITGRGIIAALDALTGRAVYGAHKVQVLKPTGEVISTEAYKESLLRRQPTPVENDAFLLKGLKKSDVPVGSRLLFVE